MLTQIVFLCITGNFSQLTLSITPNTIPDTEEVRESAVNWLFQKLSSEALLPLLAQTLSEILEYTVTLVNVRAGSIKVDMILEDMSRLEYLKELSDNWVLSNIVDSTLMTPELVEELIESCHAEDVSIKAVIDEDSYQQVKSLVSKYKLDTEHIES